MNDLVTQPFFLNTKVTWRHYQATNRDVAILELGKQELVVGSRFQKKITTHGHFRESRSLLTSKMKDIAMHGC